MLPKESAKCHLMLMVHYRISCVDQRLAKRSPAATKFTIFGVDQRITKGEAAVATKLVGRDRHVVAGEKSRVERVAVEVLVKMRNQQLAGRRIHVAHQRIEDAAPNDRVVVTLQTTDQRCE